MDAEFLCITVWALCDVQTEFVSRVIKLVDLLWSRVNVDDTIERKNSIFVAV